LYANKGGVEQRGDRERDTGGLDRSKPLEGVMLARRTPGEKEFFEKGGRASWEPTRPATLAGLSTMAESRKGTTRKNEGPAFESYQRV